MKGLEETKRRPDLLGSRGAAVAENRRGHSSGAGLALEERQRDFLAGRARRDSDGRGVQNGAAPRCTFDKAVREFMGSRRAMRCSPKTVKFYEHRIGALRRTLAAVGAPAEPCGWTPGDLRRVFQHLSEVARTRHGRPLSAATIHATFRATRTLLRFLTTEGLLPSNSLVGVAPPRTPEPLAHALTADEARRLLRAPNRRSWYGLRDAALLGVALDCGLRLSELTGLRDEDVCWEDTTVRVVSGKAGRERLVPVGRRARRLLGQWVRRRGDTPGGLVFPTRQGGRLAHRQIQRMVKRCAALAGLDPRRAHPHALRHSFATLYLRNGGDVESLRRCLGHRTHAMTARYVALQTADLVEAHAAVSPVDRLEEGR